MKNKMRAFTLMEILVSLLIVGVLTALAVVSYTSYGYKSNRGEALQTLYSMEMAQEQYRSSNTTYGTLAQVWGGVTSTSGGKYTLTITNVTATTYTVTATAVGNQVNDAENGTTCSPLSIAVSNGVETKSPSICFTQ